MQRTIRYVPPVLAADAPVVFAIALSVHGNGNGNGNETAEAVLSGKALPACERIN